MRFVISLIIETEHREDLVILLGITTTKQHNRLAIGSVDLHIGSTSHKTLSRCLKDGWLAKEALRKHRRLGSEHGERYCAETPIKADCLKTAVHLRWNKRCFSMNIYQNKHDKPEYFKRTISSLNPLLHLSSFPMSRLLPFHNSCVCFQQPGYWSLSVAEVTFLKSHCVHRIIVGNSLR